MKKLFIILSLSSYFQCIAQEKAKQFTEQVGLTTSTTAAYRINGNDTTLKNAFTLAPYFRIMHNSGLGLSYSINTIVSGTANKLFMQNVSAFYEEYDKPVNVNIRYTHFFFNNNPAVPYTPITNEVYGYVAYKKLWIAPALAASVGFGQDENNQTQSSINIAAGVTHSFSFKNKTIKEADIVPSIFLNGSDNRYYSFLPITHYINQNSGNTGFLHSKGRSHGNGNSNGGTTTTTSASVKNSFALNNVELALYSSFTIGHFEIIPDGSIFIPLNADNGFSAYWQLKLGYNFGESTMNHKK